MLMFFSYLEREDINNIFGNILIFQLQNEMRKILFIFHMYLLGSIYYNE